MINEYWGFRLGDRITVPSLWGEQMGTVVDFSTMLGRNGGRVAHVVVYRLDDGRVSSDTPERLHRVSRSHLSMPVARAA